jgi:hypothetical protein
MMQDKLYADDDYAWFAGKRGSGRNQLQLLSWHWPETKENYEQFQLN